MWKQCSAGHAGSSTIQVRCRLQLLATTIDEHAGQPISLLPRPLGQQLACLLLSSGQKPAAGCARPPARPAACMCTAHAASDCGSASTCLGGGASQLHKGGVKHALPRVVLQKDGHVAQVGDSACRQQVSGLQAQCEGWG